MGRRDGSVWMSSSYTNISATKRSHTDFCVGCSFAFVMRTSIAAVFFSCFFFVFCTYLYEKSASYEAKGKWRKSEFRVNRWPCKQLTFGITISFNICFYLIFSVLICYFTNFSTFSIHLLNKLYFVYASWRNCWSFGSIIYFIIGIFTKNISPIYSIHIHKY